MYVFENIAIVFVPAFVVTSLFVVVVPEVLSLFLPWRGCPVLLLCRVSSVLSKTSRGCPDVKQRKLLLITLFIFSIVSKEVGDDIDAGLGKQDGG